MDIITLIVTAVALGMDAFAVSAAVAACVPAFSARHTFRLSWHFGLFQFLMTVVGWLGGEAMSVFLGGINHLLACGLLFFLGIRMIWSASKPEECSTEFDPTRGFSLVALSVATSLDALAVGISFSLIGLTVWTPSVVIGLTALVMAYIGTKLGKRAGTMLGPWAERVGGAVLIIIGIRIAAEYVM